jgi:hypothetical protein
VAVIPSEESTLTGEPRTTRRVRMGLVLTSAALITSACAAGKDSQTTEERPSLDGANADIGKIALRGIAIKTPTDGVYAKGADVDLTGVISNDGGTDDGLVSIATTSATAWTTSGPLKAEGAAGITIPAGEHISFGIGEAAGEIVLNHIAGKLYPAGKIRVTFTFAKAGPVTRWVPVQISETRNNLTVPPVSDDTGD